jgi:hypothetical protein
MDRPAAGGAAPPAGFDVVLSIDFRSTRAAAPEGAYAAAIADIVRVVGWRALWDLLVAGAEERYTPAADVVLHVDGGLKEAPPGAGKPPGA